MQKSCNVACAPQKRRPRDPTSPKNKRTEASAALYAPCHPLSHQSNSTYYSQGRHSVPPLESRPCLALCKRPPSPLCSSPSDTRYVTRQLGKEIFSVADDGCRLVGRNGRPRRSSLPPRARSLGPVELWAGIRVVLSSS
jgi:hypothetical protein